MEGTDPKRRKVSFETSPQVESTSASRNLWSKRLALYIDRFPKLRDLEGNTGTEVSWCSSISTSEFGRCFGHRCSSCLNRIGKPFPISSSLDMEGWVYTLSFMEVGQQNLRLCLWKRAIQSYAGYLHFTWTLQRWHAGSSHDRQVLQYLVPLLRPILVKFDFSENEVIDGMYIYNMHV